MSNERYLVPRFSFADGERLRELLFSAFDKLEDCGFEFVESKYEESDIARMTRFSDEPETSHVEYVEDYLKKVRYIRIAAPNETIVSQISSAVADSIDMESHEDLCASAAENTDPTLLYRIACSAPTSPTVMTSEVIIRALQQDDEEVVQAAAGAAGIVGWPVFVGPLEEISAKTEPGKARRAINQALRLLRQE